MKKIIHATLLLLSLMCLASVTTVSAGGPVGDMVSDAAGDALDGFLRSIGEYFVAPDEEVISVRDKYIPDEEIPVIFYLAQQARVPTSEIIELRLKGLSWQEIADRYGLGPDIFYVPINENVKVGPPYGHAYGYYKNKPKKDWKKIKLRDDDIVNLVNLKFISGHYNYPATTIMKMREKHKGFNNISYEIEEQREANRKHAKAASYEKAESGNNSDDKGSNKSENKGNKGHGNSGNKGKNKGK